MCHFEPLGKVGGRPHPWLNVAEESNDGSSGSQVRREDSRFIIILHTRAKLTRIDSLGMLPSRL